MDPRLEFRPATPTSTGYSGSTWNLGLVNDLPFNIYGPDPELLDLERFPFRVTWTGDADVAESGVVSVSYVGEGTLTLGDRSVGLPPTYAAGAVVEVPAPPGEVPVHIEYAFTSTIRVGEESEGPYATFVVEGVRPAGPGVAAQFIAAAVDVLVLLAVAGVSAIGVWEARRRSLAALAAVAAAVGAVFVVHALGQAGVLPELIRDQLSPAVLVGTALVGGAVVWRPRLALPVGVPVALVTAVLEVGRRVGHLGEVLYRSRGDDWLTYQAFARTMLAGDPLRGAEDVFYYQPGFRYLLYVARLLLGDSDALVATAQVAGFAVVALLLVVTALRRSGHVAGRLYGATALAALWVFGFTQWFLEKCLVGLSEVPAWIALLGIGVLMVRPLSLRTGLWVTGLAGAVVLVRPNQLPAMAVLVGVVALLLWQQRPAGAWRRSGVVGATFLVMLLLPLAHNVVYGSAFEVLPTGANTVEDLPLGRLTDVLSDGQVREVLADKTKGLLHVGGSGFSAGSSVLSPFALMQVLWLAAVVAAMRRWRGRLRIVALALMAWPLTFAASHVSYDIWIYYPRHVVAFNLSMVVGSLVVQGTAAGFGDRLVGLGHLVGGEHDGLEVDGGQSPE